MARDVGSAVSLGKLVLDEIPCDIERIYMADGCIHFVAVIRVDRPTEGNVNGDFAIFAPDGTYIGSAPSRNDKPFRLAAGCCLTVDLPIELADGGRMARVAGAKGTA